MVGHDKMFNLRKNKCRRAKEGLKIKYFTNIEPGMNVKILKSLLKTLLKDFFFAEKLYLNKR